MNYANESIAERPSGRLLRPQPWPSAFRPIDSNGRAVMLFCCHNMATVWGADDIHRLIALFRSNEVIVVDKSQGIPQAWRARFQALKKLSV